jgi:hypothetical protein
MIITRWSTVKNRFVSVKIRLISGLSLLPRSLPINVSSCALLSQCWVLCSHVTRIICLTSELVCALITYRTPTCRSCARSGGVQCLSPLWMSVSLACVGYWNFVCWIPYSSWELWPSILSFLPWIPSTSPPPLPFLLVSVRSSIRLFTKMINIPIPY